MENWLNIKNRVYVVTGGSSGIGDAIVKELSEEGAQVVNADLNAPEVLYPNVEFIETDVTNRENIDSTVNKVVKEFGHIDGLVNNAGINLPRLLVDDKEANSQYEMTESDWMKMFSVNVKTAGERGINE